MLKWLAGIIATVISGLIIWWVTGLNGETPVPPRPTPPGNQGPRIEYDPYERFIKVVTTKEARGPINDNRVKEAIKLVIRGDDLKKGKMLMAQSGYPNGIELIMLLANFKHIGGSEGEARLLINKVRPIGVRVQLMK